MLTKRGDCDVQKDLVTTHISETEQQLLETLDNIKVVHQAYDGNVFIDKDEQIILNNY